MSSLPVTRGSESIHLSSAISSFRGHAPPGSSWQQPKDVAIVMQGGADSQRIANRRQQVGGSYSGTSGGGGMIADLPEGDQEDDDWEEDDKKYA